MTELIDSLTIRGFRGFRDLTIPEFGKVNLITGKNNTGKSSVLEAIRILVAGGAAETLHTILRYREEIPARTDSRDLEEREDFNLIRGLFLGFPDILELDESPTFSIQVHGSLPANASNLTIRTTWISHRFGVVERRTGPLHAEDMPLAESDAMDIIPALSIQTGEKTRVFPLKNLIRPPAWTRRTSTFEKTPSDLARFIHLDSFNPGNTSQFGDLWDGILLTDVQEEVLKALQLVSPDIQAVSMIGGESRSSGRTAIVRSKRFASRVPLRSYGDGINRVFGIILSLCNDRNGILLIDEIENGLHYSVQPLVWKTIFQLAQKLDVQVFATTHSRDCVLAFQQAAAQSPAEGRLIRLTRKDDWVLPTVFSEDKLQFIADNDIEVR